MGDPRFPRIVYFLLLAMGLLQWARAYGRLPERMASHFGVNGAPNGWMPKEIFFVFMSVTLAVTAVVTFLVPRLIAAKSPDRINLPNKAYWLAAEHTQETHFFLSAYMGWFGCMILFVLLYGTSQAMNANLPGGHFDSQSMFHVMVAFVFLTVVGTILLIRHFSRIPPSRSSASGTPIQR